MLSDTTFILVMSFAVAILGLSKGGFAGIGMVSTPMVAAFVDPMTAVGLMLPIMVIQDVVGMVLYRQSYDVQILKVMIPGGAIGVLVAYFFASTVPDWTVKAVLGVVSFVFSLWQLSTVSKGVPEGVLRSKFDTPAGLFAGAASGFTSAIAHAGPPPFQIYVMPKNLRKEVYVGTSVMFFSATNAIKLPSFVALGLFSVESLNVSAVFVPLAIAASWTGARLVRVVNPKSFTVIVTLIMLCISFALMWQAWSESNL